MQKQLRGSKSDAALLSTQLAKQHNAKDFVTTSPNRLLSEKSQEQANEILR